MLAATSLIHHLTLSSIITPTRQQRLNIRWSLPPLITSLFIVCGFLPSYLLIVDVCSAVDVSSHCCLIVGRYRAGDELDAPPFHHSSSSNQHSEACHTPRSSSSAPTSHSYHSQCSSQQSLPALHIYCQPIICCSFRAYITVIAAPTSRTSWPQRGSAAERSQQPSFCQLVRFFHVAAAAVPRCLGSYPSLSRTAERHHQHRTCTHVPSDMHHRSRTTAETESARCRSIVCRFTAPTAAYVPHLLHSPSHTSSRSRRCCCSSSYPIRVQAAALVDSASRFGWRAGRCGHQRAVVAAGAEHGGHDAPHAHQPSSRRRDRPAGRPAPHPDPRPYCRCLRHHCLCRRARSTDGTR